MGQQDRTRRGFLRIGAVAGAGLLAGCQFGSRQAEEIETVTPAPIPAIDRTTVPLPSTTLDVHHAAVGDSGPAGTAMTDLLRQYRAEHAQIDVRERPLAPLLENGVRADGPSDGEHAIVGYGRPGARLRPLAEAGDLEGMRPLWRGLDNQIGSGPASVCLLDQQRVAVPQTVTRLNCLYYDPSIVDRTGVDPAAHDTFRGFTAQLDTVAESVQIPFATPLASPRDFVALWELLLAGRVGAVIEYLQLVSGTVADHRRTVREATVDFAAALDVIPQASRTTGPGAMLAGVLDGSVGFVRLPSTAAVPLLKRGEVTYGDNWTVSALPGTDGRYPFSTEAFFVPRNSAKLSVTRALLSLATSPSVQQRFNAIRGSVPPWTYYSEEYAPQPFYADQWETYRRARRQFPSIAHDLAVSPRIRRAVGAALVAFEDHRDIERATDEILEALDGATVL